MDKARRKYLQFRRKYARMINAAKREMDTPMQRGLVDALLATGYMAGLRDAGMEAPKPMEIKPWKPK